MGLFPEKKKKSPLFSYIYRPTERTMLLLSSKMHLTQGKGSTFRPNLPKRYRLPGGSAAATAVMSLQSCSTLCNPVDSSPPGSVVPGILQTRILKWVAIAFSPGGSVVKNLPVIAGDAGLIPGLERSLREGNGNPLQYSCLGNPMGRGAWQATIHGVTKMGHNLATKQQQSTLVVLVTMSWLPNL